MKKVFFVVFLCVMFTFTSFAQTAAPQPATVGGPSAETPKRSPVFRATKAQIKGVQTMLLSKKLYSGEATGKLDDSTRMSIKSYQKDNGLKETGTLNRVTLEKMGIELTDSQKATPVSSSSSASSETLKPSTGSAAGETKPKRVIFRATKNQIMEAQKMLKSKGMYAGGETGKLDDDTREGLKKFQTANDVKVTGTLNQVTLEKMGIALTDKQKESDTNNK